MVIFRTHASPKKGFGCLKRSSYLASLLKKKHPALFYVNNDKTALNYLKNRSFLYCLTKDWEDVKRESIRSMIFDLKSLDQEDLNLLQWAKKNNIRTAQFTDLGENQIDVDYTVDASIEKLYPYGSKKKILNGPDFSILHNSFRHFNKIKRKYREKIKNVFLCLGSSTEYRQLRRVIDSLSRHSFNLKIATGFYLKKSNKKILRRIYPSIRFVGKTESLARSIYESDIAIIPSSTLAFEAASIGTPALYVFNNRKQEFSAELYEKEGTGLKLSSIETFSNSEITKKMNELGLKQREEMGKKGKVLVDGMGVYRIIDFFKNKGII